MLVVVTSDLHFIAWQDAQTVPAVSEVIQTDKGLKQVARVLSSHEERLPNWLEAIARPVA
ncbi:MAG: hypothetical protein ACYCW6_18890 [Candidatus Xenobia bacterium]